MKTLKLFILLAFIALSFNLFSQDFDFAIERNSIRLYNNRINFKVKVTNKTNYPYVFYNLTYWDFEGFIEDSVIARGVNSTEFHPRLMLIVKNNKNKICPYRYSDVPGFYLPKYLSKSEKARLDRMEKYRDEHEKKFGKYMVIPPKSMKQFIVTERMSKLGLKNGNYTIQVKYLSNYHFTKEFDSTFLKNDKYKDYQFYRGYLKSNICKFKYIR